jgi:BirA family biotin operon repressor/biotin-[acetyl-CoA-carboxylase] ligase
VLGADISANGTHLYAFPVNKDLSELAGLSLVIGLAIISSLNEFDLPEKLELKWPNDIMYQNKKLVGILIDVLAESNSESYVIIGVGINANMKEDPDNIITQKWISLGEILNSYIDRSSLFIKVFKKITLYLQKFEEKGFEYFVDEYHNFDTLFGKEIKVISGNSEVKGKAIGINNRGNLKLELENGEIKICSSGDTSIVK